MRVLQTVRERKLDLRGKTVGAAVSGGSDSVALLHFLRAHQSELGIAKLICVNVEHGIRGSDSRADSEFVQKLCEKWDIPLLFTSASVPSLAKTRKVSLELAARELRYEYFRELISLGECDLVATAHNLSDNAETVLMNVLRGSGGRGAAGIPYESAGIVRPLLDTPKSEIMEYISRHGLEYAEDASNLDTAYTRNFVRHGLIPLAETRFPGASAALAAFASALREDGELLDSLARELIFPDRGALLVRAENRPPALVKRALGLALERLGAREDAGRAHYAAALRLIASGSAGDGLDFPGGVRVASEYGSLAVYLEGGEVPRPLLFSEGIAEFGSYALRMTYDEPFSPKKGRLQLDADKLPKAAQLRCIQSGDRFKALGGGTKKLCDYFTDIKLPLRLRAGVPLICAGSEVLAVCGIEVSDRVKITSDTRKTLTIYTEYLQRSNL